MSSIQSVASSFAHRIRQIIVDGAQLGADQSYGCAETSLDLGASPTTSSNLYCENRRRQQISAHGDDQLHLQPEQAWATLLQYVAGQHASQLPSSRKRSLAFFLNALSNVTTVSREVCAKAVR